MNVVDIIVLVIVLIYICTSLRLPLVVLYHNLLLKKLTKFKNKEFVDFYVLLPGLREQKLVKDTIEYFNKMDYPKDKLHICIVTTERETFEYSKNNIKVKTTRDISLELINNYEWQFDTLNIHYPNNVGNKASQLNYAIKQLMKGDNFSTNSYFAMFDFDSRPNFDYFQLANKIIELKKMPDIVQSVPFFLSNINEISKNAKNFLCVDLAMEQACRSSCIEIWNLMANSSKINLFPLYAMGASLIVKTQTLIEQDYIPEPVDDLPLGFRYFINKKKFCYLPSLVFGDLPEKTKMFFNQSILIQKGNIMALNEIKRKGTAKFTLWRRFLVFCEFFTAFFLKFMLPIPLLVYLLLNITTFNFVCLLIILAPYLRFFAGFCVTRFFAREKIKIKTLLLSFVFAFLIPFCMGYGPFKNILLETQKKLFNKQIIYKKTE